MNKTKVLKTLFDIANDLDKSGYVKEANSVTKLMVRVSGKYDQMFRETLREINDDDDFTPGRHEMFERDLPGELDDEEMSDYSFSGDQDDFDYDEDMDDFTSDDDDIIKEFDYEVSPGKHEDFESDMPGEIPDFDSDNLEFTIREELEKKMPDASEDVIEELVIQMMQYFNKLTR